MTSHVRLPNDAGNVPDRLLLALKLCQEVLPNARELTLPHAQATLNQSQAVVGVASHNHIQLVPVVHDGPLVFV